MGRLDPRSDMRFDRPTATRPNGLIKGVLMSANGLDGFSLYSNLTMIITDPVKMSGILFGPMTLKFGFGKFEGCYGEAEMIGTFDMLAEYIEWTAEGTISY
jgi:hypothetical protein